MWIGVDVQFADAVCEVVAGDDALIQVCSCLTTMLGGNRVFVGVGRESIVEPPFGQVKKLTGTTEQNAVVIGR